MFYRKSGFVVLEDFLSPEEVGMWWGSIHDAIARQSGETLPTTQSYALNWQKARTPEKVLFQRINLWKDSPKVRELILDCRIGKLAADLEGVDGIRV